MSRLALATALAAAVIAAGPVAAQAAPLGTAPSRTAPTPAADTGIATEATHAFIIEADTGTVLLDKAADARMPSASLSKMMTAYVVFSMLKDGRAKLDEELPVSAAAWRTGGSKMFVPLGGKVSIDNLLQGMLVQSGNDACIVLAQGLAGSQAAFVQLMNEKAKEIGLTDSHFDDVDGLPDPQHWVTARDLAILAMATIRNFPEYYHYYSQPSFTFDGIKQGNRNPLLYDDIGADGLKTGHTDESGYSLVGSVVRGKRRIILVLSGLPSKRARAQEGKRLAEWALRQWGDYSLFSAGTDVEDAPVWLGAEPTVALTVTHDLVVTLPRPARKGMTVTLDYRSPVPAPVAKGQAIGTLAVTAPGMTPRTVPLVAARAVGRLGAIGRVAALAGYFVWGNR